MNRWKFFLQLLGRKFILIGGLAAAGFVITQWVLPVFYQPSEVLTLTEVGEHQIIRLRKNFKAGSVHALKIRIRGQLNGTAMIRVFDSEDKTKINRGKLIGSGEIDTRLDGDWYTDDCRIEYQPLSATQGGLKIDYLFKSSRKI